MGKFVQGLKRFASRIAAFFVAVGKTLLSLLRRAENAFRRLDRKKQLMVLSGFVVVFCLFVALIWRVAVIRTTAPPKTGAPDEKAAVSYFYEGVMSEDYGIVADILAEPLIQEFIQIANTDTSRTLSLDVANEKDRIIAAETLLSGIGKVENFVFLDEETKTYGKNDAVFKAYVGSDDYASKVSQLKRVRAAHLIDGNAYTVTFWCVKTESRWYILQTKTE